MKRLAAQLLFATLSAALASAAAHAQSFRAYLSSSGSDANPCTVTQPCRLLPAALNAVSSGGEIWMLDSANYTAGTVTVSKDVNISAIPGQVGSVVAVSGAPAMSLSPGVIVSVRNLAFANNVNNPGGVGITMTTGALTVHETLFAMAQSQVTTQAAITISGAGGHLAVHESVFRGGGVRALGTPLVEIANSRFIDQDGTNCVFLSANQASGTAKLAVRDSAFMGCNGGVIAFGDNAAAVARVTVTRSTFSNGTFGVVSQVNSGGADLIVTLSGCEASGNVVAGFAAYFGGVLESLGNNTARNNASNTVGTVTVVPQI
jgi:hypothetical protein